jgi:Carboxypeptidase regulatory-like domain
MIYYAALTHMFGDPPRGSSRVQLRALRALLYFTLVMVSIAIGRPAAAQTGATGGDVSGIVRDPLAAVLPGATVTATNLEVGLTRTVVTETNGRFLVPALPPGVYRLQIDFPGFAPYVAEDVRVALGGLLDLDVRMELAGTQEQVTVRGDAPYGGNRNTTVSALVSRTQIEELPVDRRNFIGFTLLTPGVTTDRIPQQTQGATPTSGLSFAGQRPRSNNITVDGLDNNDITVGAVRATFSQDAVREYQVLASSYSAEFGKASGGLVNIVTRSGTNAFENQAFVFSRNDALSAKNYFERVDPAGNPIDRPKAPYSQLQAGATSGGPIRRDRTFYFGSFERLRVDASNFVTIDDRTVVTHPLTGQPLGTPAGLLRSNGFPLETGDVPYVVRFDTLFTKIDHELTPSHRLAGRFNWASAPG